MPDASHTPLPPRDWHDAFAMLPLEAPPRDGWRALGRRRRPVVRQRLAWAAAAALLLALLVPALWSERSVEHARPAPLAGATSPATRPARPPAPSSGVPPVHGAPHAGTRADSAPARVAQRDTKRPVPAATAGADDSPAITPPGAADVADHAPASVARASVPADAARPTPGDTPPTQAPRDDASAALERLYAESARLEALAAMARDERVADAGALLIGDGLESRVADIDAALAQPGLADSARVRLWTARIAALRQLAGYATTQRSLAGAGRDALRLASID